jgi:hypothetical protein
MVDNEFETAIKTRIQRQEGGSFEQIWPVRCYDTCLTNKTMILEILLVNTAGAMSYEPPKPPTDLPDEIVDTLDDYSPDLLRDVASYAEELAEYREREARLEEQNGRSEVEERPDDLPDDVPSRATITIKEINDNRYYYWQWREGDQVKSKYKGPVNSDE